MTLVSLVFGGSQAHRERAIAAAAAGYRRSIAIVEGMPDRESPLEALPATADLDVIRVAAGCPCCDGNLTVRVMLNRALRRRPDRLYLSLSNASHKQQVLDFLQEPQYLALLQFGADIDCS